VCVFHPYLTVGYRGVGHCNTGVINMADSPVGTSGLLAGDNCDQTDTCGAKRSKTTNPQ
jgi:hypothetical protein